MFSVQDRNDLRQRLLGMASADPRVVAGAALGSLAHGEGDRWSDIDLMLGVADAVPLIDVMEDWSRSLTRELDAIHLFDLESGPATYRVFLLPNGLELDLSFAPASEFGPSGPKFDLLFGEAVEREWRPPSPAAELFGYAVHHAFHARACIERGRFWQAEYWISAVRDHTLHLACRSRGLEGDYGRDFDALPADVLEPLKLALVSSLEPDELRRALGVVVAALLRGSTEVPDMARKLEGPLLELSEEQPP